MSQLSSKMPVLGDLESIQQAWENFDPAFAMFYSSPEATGVQTDAYIPNTDTGWLDGAAGDRALWKLGQAASTMGTEELVASPYSTRLRPVMFSQTLESAKRLYITRVEFRAYDVTKTGATEQNAAVLAEIEASASTINDAYIQSRYLGGEIGGWQPNFFRPKISAGGKTLFSEAAGTFFSPYANLGDKSIGFPLPFEYEPPMPVFIGAFSAEGIQVWAGAGQIIDVGGTFWMQRYAISCFLELIASKK